MGWGLHDSYSYKDENNDHLHGGLLCQSIAAVFDGLTEVEVAFYKSWCMDDPHEYEQYDNGVLTFLSQTSFRLDNEPKGVLAVRVAGVVGIAISLLSLLHLLWKHGSQALRIACSPEPLPRAFKEKILDYKVNQMRGLLRVSCYLLLPVTAWSTLKVLNRSAIICFAQIMLALCAVFPRVITPRTFDVVYCGCALLVVLGAAPFTCCDDDILPTICLLNAAMMALINVRRTMFTRVPVLLLVNCAFGFATTTLMLRRPRTENTAFSTMAVVCQGFIVVLMTLGAPFLERLSRAWMCKLLELEELQELLGASRSLLRSCFDVVVELDDAACIASTGPELGALLLRERQCMEGQSFLELIEGAELRAVFEQRLAIPMLRSLGLAENMQISIRDACGNVLSLEMMWFEFRHTGTGDRRFMVGLREFSDGVRPAREARQPAEAAPRQSSAKVETLPAHQSSAAVAPAKRTGNDAAPVPAVPETHSESVASFEDAGAVVVLDCSQESLPVHKASHNFRVEVGRLRRGAAFTKCLRKPQKFQDWLLLALNARALSTRPPDDGKVTFAFPQGKIKAWCRLVAMPDGYQSSASASGNEEGKAGDHVFRMDRVAVLFYNIRRARDVGDSQASNATDLTPLSSGSSKSLQAAIASL